MGTNKPPGSTDYVTPLLQYLQTDLPSENPARPEPRQESGDRARKRGRKKKMVNKSLGQFFKAIAEINSKNRKYTTFSSLAGKLKPEYSDLSERHLRRNVSFAIGKIIDLLKTCPPDSWERLFHIAPPASMTQKLLREKAFEFLRLQLSQQQRAKTGGELMAKKPE